MTTAISRLHLLVVILIVPLTSAFNPFIRCGGCTRLLSLSGLSMTQQDVDAETARELYNIKHSCWTSPEWNWGYARGTGHDCAVICRRRWSEKSDRQQLVESLLNPVGYHSAHHDHEVPFEEVKLILGLLWQRSVRSHAYSKVLENMAEAKRYEIPNDEVLSALNFISDIRYAFPDVARSNSDKDHMDAVASEVLQYHNHMVERDDVFRIRRVCTGMVLEAMGFVEQGI